MTDAPPPPDPGSGQSSFNSASGDASVGAQFGFVTGDVYYTVTDNQQPGERYLVAFRFLEGGATERAAELIKDAVEHDYRGGDDVDPHDDKITANHIAFHWMLAILSGRPLEQLTADDFTGVKLAWSLRDASAADDQWLPGCDLVWRLLACLRRQERTGRPEPTLSRVLGQYKSLSERCQDRIGRHLDVLLVAGQADQREAYSAEDAVLRRMSEDRQNRAWKFFEPTPEKPRERQSPKPDLTTGARVLCGAGLVLGLASLVYWIILLQSAGVLAAVLVALGLVAGAASAGPAAIAFLALRIRLAEKEREIGRAQVEQGRYRSQAGTASPAELDETDEETEEAERTQARRKKFIRVVNDHLRKEFSKHAPRPATPKKKWHSDTAGLRTSLKDEILSLYPQPDLRLGSVNWLISYRVGQIARQWQAKKLTDFRSELRPSLRTVAGLSLGSVAFAVAGVYAVIVMIISRPAAGVIATLAMLLAGALVATSRIDLYLVQQRAIRDGKPDLDKAFAQEMTEYERVVEELKDRPGDDEIARWLDFDKIYLKTLAMNQLGLGRRDILQYATLIEPGPGWIGARVLFGPPRYSLYVVSVFLLTDAGVRQVTVTLDFLTGVAGNQVRRSFRHDAIASATVVETGIRFDTGRREAMPSESQRDRRGAARAIEGRRPDKEVDASLILRQEIGLRLMSSETIRFRVENFDADYLDSVVEDAASLLNIALDTSGITAVLELLEAISGHGAQWVTQRERRRRWRDESDLPDDESTDGDGSDQPA